MYVYILIGAVIVPLRSDGCLQEDKPTDKFGNRAFSVCTSVVLLCALEPTTKLHENDIQFGRVQDGTESTSLL